METSMRWRGYTIRLPRVDQREALSQPERCSPIVLAESEAEMGKGLFGMLPAIFDAYYNAALVGPGLRKVANPVEEAAPSGKEGRTDDSYGGRLP